MPKGLVLVPDPGPIKSGIIWSTQLLFSFLSSEFIAIVLFAVAAAVALDVTALFDVAVECWDGF